MQPPSNKPKGGMAPLTASTTQRSTRPRRCLRLAASTRRGIAKNAREEKLRAQRQKAGTSTPEDERMAALYRQHVLKEQAPEPVIKIAGLGGKKKPVQDVVHNKPE